MAEIIVVVGGVAGGASFAARMRRLDESAEIILLERGEHISFANCGLPYFISGEIASRERLLVSTPAHFRRNFRIDVRVRHEALAIDRQAKTIRVRDLETQRTYDQPYSKLVLSPGAEPLRPPLPGMDHPRIFSLRTVEDAVAIREFITAHQAERAVVMGGGFIGLEMLENLQHLGLHMTLVEMAPQVMLPLDPEMAEWVHQHLRLRGTELLLGHAVERFAEDASGRLVVTVAGGSTLTCDLVISAIGVRPETRLARDAGLALGERGGIAVDATLRTTDTDIYAIGDAIETEDGILGGRRLVPLAGLANKQGRRVADHIAGKSIAIPGALGTSIVRVFDLTVAATGANEKSLKTAGVPYEKSYTHSASHAGYYPGAAPLVAKLLFDPADGRILGAQIVGVDGVDKRIDVLSTAIRAGMTVEDLTELELAYSPQYGTGKDAVNIAGYVAANVVQGDIQLFHGDEVEQRVEAGGFLLDVRTVGEFERNRIPGAVNIPVHEVRDRLDEIPRDRTLLVYCLTGIRSYYACCVLSLCGFTPLNLSGGYVLYCAMRPGQGLDIPGLERWRRLLALETFCLSAEERRELAAGK